MKIRYSIIALLFIATTAFITTDEVPLVSKLKAQLIAFLRANNEEKIYVQTDKTLYKAGEYIWFNAFLTDASTGKPSNMSNIVYIEVYDPKGNLTQKLRLHVKSGTAGGEMRILDTHPGGLYRIKAYTTRMVGLEEDRCFYKEIQVQKVITPRLLLKPDFEKKAYGAGDEVSATLLVTDLKNEKAQQAEVKVKVNIEGKTWKEFTVHTDDEGKTLIRFSLPDQLNSPDGLLQAIVSYRGVEESVSRSIPIVLNKINLKFYPEGGTWIAGIPSRMAFEAVNEFGKGADVSGEILDENGRTVGTFESFHFGMGAFEMNPGTGKKYSARILKPQGTNTLFALPPAELQSYGLNLKKQDKTTVSWNIYSPENNAASLIAQVNGLIYDSKTVQLTKGINTIDFNTEKLPAGIAVFTLFKESGEPVCERLVLVNPEKKLNIAIKTDKPKYLPGEKVIAEIKTTNEKGKPVPANLSLAVVDEQLLTMADDKQDNILTYLLLSSDLKGKIYEPSFYFNDKEAKSEKAVDYLLLTHGWRRFTWSDVNNPNFKKLPNAENIGHVYGQIIGKGGKPVKTEVTLVELNNKKRVMKIQTTDSGEFAFLNVDPAASIALFTKRSNVITISGIKPASIQIPPAELDSSIRALLRTEAIPVTVENSSTDGIYREKVASNGQSTWYGSGSSGYDADLLFGGESTLDEVVIVGYGMGSKRSLSSSVVTTSVELSMFNITESLSGRVAGLMVQEDNANPGNAKKIMIRGITSLGESGSAPLIVIDGVPVPARGDNISALSIINPADIIMIEVLKGAEASCIFGQEAANGVISIQTVNPRWNNSFYTKRIEQKPIYETHMVYPDKSVNVSRAYYDLAPRFVPKEGVRSDFRTTVYWQNSIFTDKDGIARVEYYNNEATSAFRISAEGINASGLVGRAEQTYSTQLPVSLDAKLPNYLSFADTLQIPVLVRNNTEKILQPEIQIELNSGLRVLSDEKISTTIQPQTSQTVFFKLVPTGYAGVHSFEIRLKEHKFTDVIKHKLNIFSTGFPRSFSISGKEEMRSASFEIRDAEPNSVKGIASVHINILDELFAGTESILREPYGCFEQVSSSTFPNIFVMQLMQATGKGNESMRQKALDYIQKGYQKLISYEIPGGGFEWFGHPPANEALTAYGLVEFHEMNKVYAVDTAMMERTKAYLLKRRNPDGTFIQTKGGFDHLASAPYSINCAYVVYALTETGVKDIDDSYNHSLLEAEKSGDMYRMALMSLAARNLGKEEDCTRLVNNFYKFIKDNNDIESLKVETTIVRSYGKACALEAVSLWAVSLMREANPDWLTLEKCIRYITSQRGNYGYGSTQATAMALKALSDYAMKKSADLEAGNMTLRVNGFPYELPYSQYTKNTISESTFADRLIQGINKVDIQFSNVKSLHPYSVVIKWNAKTPESSDKCKVNLTTTLSQNRVKLNETVRLSIKLQNKDRQQGQPMSMAVIGIPAGLSPQPWQLKELQEKGVFDFYEILENRLAIYYRTLGVAETKSVELDLKADIPGKFVGSASSGYLYYGQEDRDWVEGLEISIDTTP